MIKLKEVYQNDDTLSLDVQEVIKSLKGTPIRRYKNNVGKKVGPQIYIHRNYASEIIPTELLNFALYTLKVFNPDFKFNSIMWNEKTNEIRFDEAPDFDTAREPHVGKYISVFSNGTIREGKSNNIWHHKWLWVKDDYKGFDVDSSKKWSNLWISKLGQVAKGTDTSFNAQLKDVGLNEAIDLEKLSWEGEKYTGLIPMNLDVAKVDASWKKDHDLYVPPGGRGPQTINLPRYERFIDFLQTIASQGGDAIIMPRIGYDTLNKRIQFGNGRHRFAVLRDMGLKKIPAMVPREQQELFKQQFMENKQFITEASQDEAALDFLKQAVRNGPWRGKVYLAGGAVRDMVMGKVPKDLDLVVTNHGETGGMDFARWLAQKMGNFKEGSNPVLFPTFGTAKVNLTGIYNGVDLEGFQVEAVFARKEVYTPGSRKPKVSPGTIEDDAFRRDFTVNSLMLDLTTDQMLDITGKGKQDINNGIIRTTSDPNEIFGQDALRMFRAVRFASKYNWKIDPDTFSGIKNNLNLLITNNTSKERIADELGKMLTHSNPDIAMYLLRDLGLLPYLGSEFQQMVNMTQNKHHVDANGNPVTVFDHTINVLKGTRPDLLERLIALFHDIGKVVTRSITPKGVQFIGHEAEGPAIAERIMKDLKYPTDIIKAVKLGISEHMKLKHGGDDAVAISDATLRKFKIKLGKNLETVLRVIHADNMAHSPASQMPNQIAKVTKRLIDLNIPEAPELPYDGNEIMKRFGVSGPAVGILQDMLINVWYKKGKLSEHDADAIIKGVLPQLPALIQKRKTKPK